MNKQVKLFIDNRNLERVKFYFLNSLNIDPTFENYREDYEYAKKNNVFEIHKDMMPFNNNKNSWNEEYFNSLQDDLNINFSERRLEHMIEVAKVVFREKIIKLEKERKVLIKKEKEPVYNISSQKNKVEDKENENYVTIDNDVIKKNNIMTIKILKEKQNLLLEIFPFLEKAIYVDVSINNEKQGNYKLYENDWNILKRNYNKKIYFECIIDGKYITIKECEKKDIILKREKPQNCEKYVKYKLKIKCIE